MTRDWSQEARVVTRLAGSSRSYPTAARVIRGSVNNCYEVLAASVLERTEAKALAMGMDVAEHHATVANYILLQAADSAIRVRK